MKYRLLLSVLGASVLIGCASPTQQAEHSARIKQASTPVQVPVPVPFDEAHARKAMEPGTATLKGVLYHRVAMSGKNAGTDPALTINPAHNVGGVKVALYPASAHLTELLRLETENRRQRASSKTAQLKHYTADPRLSKYGRFTRTDEHGRYVFTGLKPGKYHLIADNVEVTSRGSEVVVTGASVVTTGIYNSQVTHYGNRNYRVKTPLEYDEQIEIPSGQNEVTMESRMRFHWNLYPRH